MTNLLDSSSGGLDMSSKRYLRALEVDEDAPVLIDPEDPEQRAAAIELASTGQARLVSFQRKVWELHAS